MVWVLIKCKVLSSGANTVNSKQEERAVSSVPLTTYKQPVLANVQSVSLRESFFSKKGKKVSTYCYSRWLLDNCSCKTIWIKCNMTFAVLQLINISSNYLQLKYITEKFNKKYKKSTLLVNTIAKQWRLQLQINILHVYKHRIYWNTCSCNIYLL